MTAAPENERHARLTRRLKLRELRVLLSVARHGSLARAAEHLAISQPAVSKAIADLEHTAGVQLFERTNRGVVLTDQGRVLLQRATNVFDELKLALEELDHLADPAGGEVRVGSSLGLVGGLVPRAVESMYRDHPRIRYQIVEGELEGLEQQLRMRAIDIAVSRVPHDGFHDDIVFEHLFDERLFVVAGSHHPLAGRRSVTPGTIAAEPWLLPLPDDPVSARVFASFEQLNMAVPSAIVTSMSFLLRVRLLTTGRFLTTLPGSMLSFGDVAGTVRVLPIDLPGGAATGLAYLKGRS